MKLWTFQNKLFLEKKSKTLRNSWSRVPRNWLNPYSWMAHQLEIRFEKPIHSAPIWCWHSCNGKLNSPPTIGTATLLFGDWDVYSKDNVLLELEVPTEFCLLSSYSVWNEAISRTDVDMDEYLRMFQSPLLKHEHDDIQAVVPYILREWIVSVKKLPKSNDNWEKIL